MSINEKETQNESSLARPQVAKLAIRKESSISVHSVESIDRTPNKERPSHEGNGGLSPYYNPGGRFSLDGSKSESKQQMAAYDTDIEACGSKTNLDSTRLIQTQSKPCSAWPGRDTLKRQKKMERLQRGCAPWYRLSSKTRFWLKIAIVLVVIGLAIGVGLGISKAVGGGIWKDHSPISDN